MSKDTSSNSSSQRTDNYNGHQDIRNAQWLNLSRDEEVLWWGHPSLYPHLPAIFISLVMVIGSIAGVFMFYETIGMKGFLIIPFLVVFGGLFVAIDYWRVITKFYVITDDKIVYKRGIYRRRTIEMRYENLENVTAKQSVVERLFGYGDITLSTAGTSGEDAVLEDVREPKKVSSTINQQKDDAYNQMAHRQS